MSGSKLLLQKGAWRYYSCVPLKFFKAFGPMVYLLLALLAVATVCAAFVAC